MRNVLRHVIPSMFHRRLLLLAGVSCVLMALLAAQTARLTTGSEREDRREILRKHLEKADYTPTSRGRIFDRKQRRLAEDRPGWNVAVSFRVLSGHWAYVKAREAAQRDVGRSDWRDLSAQEQDDLARAYVKPYLLQIESLKVTLAELGRVSPDKVEARQREVVRWVQKMAANATASRRKDRVKVLKKSGESADLPWAEVYVEVAEEFQSHPVLYDVAPDTITWIDRFIAKAIQEQQAHPDRPGEYEVWLEVTPQRVRQRIYPWESRTFALDRSTFPGPLQNDRPLVTTVDGIGRHILGSLRPINKEDSLWDRRPFYVRDTPDTPRRVDLAGYRPNDPIGRFGVESSMESTLRGTRGLRVTHLDTGDTETVAPLRGQDVHLTIDIQLQMRLQALMSHDPDIGLMRSQPWHKAGHDPTHHPQNPQLGDPLNGAAVVLDIDNGEVLAAVSVPHLTLDRLENHSTELYADHDNRPTLFRPTAYRYDPGSTNKPLVLAAAITDGILGPDESLDCSLGLLWPNSPNRFRDWIYRPDQGRHQTFGQIDGVQAVAVSSNVFFGQVAQRFGKQMSFNRLAWWFNQYGFGRRLGSGLPQEIAGNLPGPDTPVTESDAAYMAIGEGKVAVTPLQVAQAHATLARGGLFIPPTFIQDQSRPAPRQTQHLHLSPAARDRALRGMDASANHAGTSGLDRGTTHSFRLGDRYQRIFTVPGAKVLAKSGTADAAPLRRTHPDGTYDRNGLIIRTGYHAWVVALVQPEGQPRPTHAIAVVVEYAGSGGRVAGPLVNQIVRALAVEGYLGPEAATANRPPELPVESPPNSPPESPAESSPQARLETFPDATSESPSGAPGRG